MGKLINLFVGLVVSGRIRDAAGVDQVRSFIYIF